MAAMYGIATAWRLVALQISNAEFVYPRFDTRMSGLILGGLLALCIDRGAPNWFRERQANALGLLAVLVLCAVAAQPPYEGGGSMIWGTIPVEWATVCLIASVAAHPGAAIAQWLSARVLVAIGLVSYALYLWHFVILQAIPPSGATGATGVTGSTGSSGLTGSSGTTGASSDGTTGASGASGA